MVRKNTIARSASLTETFANFETEFREAERKKREDEKQAQLIALFPDAELVDAPIILSPVHRCFVFMGLATAGIAIPAYMIATS